MDVSFINVLITVFSLVLLMVPGYILVKTKLVGETAEKTLSVLVLYVLQPMLLITGFQNAPFSSEIIVNMLIVAGLTFTVHLVLIIIVYFIVRDKNNVKKERILRYASVFGNTGFMGAPFLQSLFMGTSLYGEVLIYNAVIVSVFNIMTWTIGIIMITGDRKSVSIKKALLTPAIIAVVIGLLIFIIAKVPLKDLAQDGSTLDLFLTKLISSIEFLSNAVTPMAMIVVGMKLAKIPFRKIFLDYKAYYSSGIKLILISFITIFTVAFLPVNSAVKYTLFFTLSMPSATNTALFAVNYNGDGDTASVCILLSTILSVLTIPIMYLLFSNFVTI